MIGSIMWSSKYIIMVQCICSVLFWGTYLLFHSFIFNTWPRLFQMGGDLEDLEAALNKSQQSHTVGSGSCSALIKLLPGNKELLVSHDTWNNYQSMLRIMKKYSFSFRTSVKGDLLSCSVKHSVTDSSTEFKPFLHQCFCRSDIDSW